MCFRRRKKKPKPVPKPTPTPTPTPVPKPTPGPPVPVPPKPPAGTLLQLVNRSTVVTDAECAQVAAALQIQVDRDYVPLWGGGPYTVQSVGRGQLPTSTAWQIAVLDTSDQAGALGYHDVTPQGLPLGKVFAKTDQQYNVPWSTTASHELLEMLGDPNIDKTVTDPKTGWVYIYENCDAVENDSYTIDGVALSDFVTPAWFTRATTTQPLDNLRLLAAPFALRPGGYISVDKHDGRGWVQIFASQADAQEAGYAARPKPGSRREKRAVPPEYRLRSSSQGDLPVGDRLRDRLDRWLLKLVGGPGQA